MTGIRAYFNFLSFMLSLQIVKNDKGKILDDIKVSSHIMTIKRIKKNIEKIEVVDLF